ncbi:MAG: hypothetical protein K9G46_15845 [Flavobacteriales bacterium]|jgi:hypothetical protein|nr:hypothetical protein [Flavobacteriales bacterium]
MKLLIDIKDNKAAFVMELLENLPFVKTQKLSSYKGDILSGLQDSIEEMNLIKEGKMKGIPAEDLLNEL